jgi:hypothetical protein
MEYIYALLDFALPNLAPWNHPVQVFVVLPLWLAISFFFIKFMFFGGLSDILDNIVFGLLEKIPAEELTYEEELKRNKEYTDNASRIANEPEPQWSKNLAIVLIVIMTAFFGTLAVIVISALIKADWTVWYEERKYFIWFLVVFVSLIAVSSIGAWIDK